MKKPEKLIGKKVRGFKFEDKPTINYDDLMDEYVGKVGEIIKIYKDNTCKIQFEDHLVEEEIPTFTKEDLRVAYKSGFNLVKRNKECDGHFERWYQKKYEPTKEEQLTEILGSSEKVSEIMELFKK